MRVRLWPLAIVVGCGPTVGGGTTEGSTGPSTSVGSTAVDEGLDATMAETPPDVPPSPPPVSCEPRPVPGSDPIDGDPCDEGMGLPMAPPEVTVQLVNQRDSAIVLVARGGLAAPGRARYFDAEGTAGGRALRAMPVNCRERWNNCESVFVEPQSCPLIGIEGTSLRIEAGGYWEMQWPATMITPVVLSGECTGSRREIECNAELLVPAGDYVLDAAGVEASECGSECECEPDALGSCPTVAISGVDLDDPAVHATAAWDGVCSEVEIVFE